MNEQNMYDRIDTLLKEQHTSKRKMSFDLDIPYTTLVSMFNRRSTSVDIETIKKIAKYLDVDLDFLASGEIYPDVTKQGTIIKEFRILKGMTQEELARASHYSLKEIKNIENHNIKLTNEEFYDLAHFVCDDAIDAIIDSDIESVSRPQGQCYAIFWGEDQSYRKFYFSKENFDALLGIAQKYNEMYMKEKGLK